MARRSIKPDHLHHLIDQLIAPRDRPGLHEYVTEGTLGGVEIVLRELESKKPGLQAHLEAIWTEYGGTAAHLWALPQLDGTSVDGLVKLASKRLVGGKSIAKQLVQETPDPDDDWDIVIKRIGATPNGIDLVALRRVERESTYDDITTPSIETEPIRIVVEVTDDDTVVAQVYATTAKARAAFLHISETLLASTFTKRRTPARDKQVRPILFTEAHVFAIAKKLNMEEYGYEGPSADGKLKKFAVETNLQGTRHEPLPMNRAEVKQNHASAKDMRQYQCEFEHQDGFVEHNKVAFYFSRGATSAHPHVTFRTRPSRLAVRAIVDELRNLAG